MDFGVWPFPLLGAVADQTLEHDDLGVNLSEINSVHLSDASWPSLVPHPHLQWNRLLSVNADLQLGQQFALGWCVRHDFVQVRSQDSLAGVVEAVFQFDPEGLVHTKELIEGSVHLQVVEISQTLPEPNIFMLEHRDVAFNYGIPDIQFCDLDSLTVRNHK